MRVTTAIYILILICIRGILIIVTATVDEGVAS